MSPFMSGMEVMVKQLEDLSRGNTLSAYQLASPSNRRHTADGVGGQHNRDAFEYMVRNHFSPMLTANDYAVHHVGSTENRATFDVVLFKDESPSQSYRFELSITKEKDMGESFEDDIGFWRTNSVLPLSEERTNSVLQQIKSRRQSNLRKLCFGSKFEDPSVSHSFGVDDTHNLCCSLGPKAKEYADANGNPIGEAAEKLNPGEYSNWSTCMGSNVCSDYAQSQHDGTRPLWAVNRSLTKVATDIPSNPDCEAYAARLLTAHVHSTPGIRTRGDPEKCAHKDRVEKGLLTKQREIDEWIASNLS